MNRKLLCVIWIASVLVIGSLLWFFTQSFRTRLLTEEVNRVLAENGGGRVETIQVFSGGPASLLTGTWFSFSGADNSSAGLNSAGNSMAGVTNVFTFTMIRNGISAACIALVDGGNRVRTIIPLSGNAGQITEELPRSVYRFYARRIEAAARNRTAAAGGLR